MKFKIAAAANLVSGYQAFFYIIGVLLVKVATSLPNLVKVGGKLKDQHQFFYIIDVLLFKVATFLPNLVKIG